MDGIRLGRFVDMDARTIGEKLLYTGERHAVIFGPNGTGKSARFLVTNLLQSTDRSIFVVDMKGELAAMTAPFRRKLGRVVILNPFGIEADQPGQEDLQSEGFNPFANLDPAAPSFNSSAALLADALVHVSKSNDGNARYFSGSAQAMFAALIMQAVIDAQAEGRKATMRDVRAMLCQPHDKGNPAADIPPVGLPAIAERMVRSKIEGLRNKAGQFLEWSKSTADVAKTAMIETEPFDDTEIADDMAHDHGFDFADMKKHITTVYLILPPEMMRRHSKWLRLIISAALQGVMRRRKPDEHRCIFYLDEYFSMGHLEAVENVYSLVRGYGIQIVPILQDMAQLKKLYGDTVTTFLGMAGAVVFFTPNDPDTVEWLEKRAGKQTALTASVTVHPMPGQAQIMGGRPNDIYHEARNPNENPSVVLNQIEVPVMRAHDLYGLPEGFCVIAVAGLSSVVPSYMPGHWEIQQCCERLRVGYQHIV